MVTISAARRILLSLPETEEKAHMGHPDFRVGGKIFATLGPPGEGWGMAKLTVEQQAAFGHVYASVRPADLEVLRHPDQIRQRIGMHFSHDVPAMKLDCIFGNSQLGGNLLIQQAGDHLPHDFLLAHSQRLVPVS